MLCLYADMKFNVTENQNSESFISSEMESLSNKISEKLTFRHRYNPLKMMKPAIIRRTRVSNEIESHRHRQQLLPVKCRKCFSRNCFCSDNESIHHRKHSDSVNTLEKLIREQTLIQEAVRRLKVKSLQTSEGTVDHYKSLEGNSEWESHYTSYESDSDVDY